MSVAFTLTGRGNGTGNFLSSTGNTLAGDVAVVSIREAFGQAGGSTPTHNGGGSPGSDFVQVGTTQADTTNSNQLRVYYAKVPAKTGFQVTVNYSSSADSSYAVSVLRGRDATSPLIVGSVGQAGDGFSPWTATSGTLEANADVLAFCGDNGGPQTYSVGAPFTIDSQEGDGNNWWTGCVASAVAPSTAAMTPSFTSTAGAQAAVLVVGFRQAAGGTAYDLTVDPASYALTAAAETVTATRALTIAPASYSLTAQAVNLAVGRVLSVSPASYALSAAAVTTAVGRALNVSPASYSLTAAAQTMTAARSLNISPVSYALTAADVTLTYAPSAKELLIDPASYAVSAADVSFAVTRALSIDPASYSLTNSAETLSVGRVLSIDPASYALSASAQTLAVGRVLSVDPVAYALTLADVTLDYRPSNPELIVDPVSYSLSLPDVEFEYGRSGGGRDDSKAKTRKRINELNKKILQAEALEEAQEAVQVAVTKAKSVKKSAKQGYDEDEDEALMLLL